MKTTEERLEYLIKRKDRIKTQHLLSIKKHLNEVKKCEDYIKKYENDLKALRLSKIVE